MNNTPRSNRLHIAVFGHGIGSSAGRCGYQCLVLPGQGIDKAGLSAVPSSKAMEVYPLGPCLFIDTPGFDDDEGELGGMRVERTLKTAMCRRLERGVLFINPKSKI